MHDSNRLTAWAIRWRVPPNALAELVAIAAPLPDASDSDGTTETSAVQRIRVDASADGVSLWRNNSGVGVNPAGRPIRFGLGNDSKQINAVMKSSDLIGLDSTGRFVAIEVKRPGWGWTGTDRERAQANFLNHVRTRGGVGVFATCWADALRAWNLRGKAGL